MAYFITLNILIGLSLFLRLEAIGQDTSKPVIEFVPPDTTFVPIDREPVPVKKVQPEYPAEAQQEKIEGTVWVKCLVGTDGKVKEADVLRSDAAILTQPAIDAILQWQFSPAESGGKPVETWVSIPFRFKLKK